MSIYNKVSELEWYLCQKALLKEFLSKNAYEKYLSDLDRFHAEWEGLHEPKIVETENKSALAVYSPINAMLVLSPGAELNLPLGYTEETFMSKQTMTIEELIKAGKMESSVEFPLKRYVVVNIGFFNNEDAEEETQLTLGHDPLTKEGIKELKELFTSLANEFDTKPNRVTYIHIVATAQTDKELKAMGY